MSNNSVAKKRVHSMTGSIEKLIRDNKIQGLVLLFQRSDCRNRDDSFHSKLFKTMNIRTKIQLGWQDAMPATVSGENK